MTRIQYDLLRAQEPALDLPDWELMGARCLDDMLFVSRNTREEVIANRAVKLMTGGFGYRPYERLVPRSQRD